MYENKLKITKSILALTVDCMMGKEIRDLK